MLETWFITVNVNLSSLALGANEFSFYVPVILQMHTL